MENELILRLKQECKELIEKVNKLNSFKATEEFYKLPRIQKDLMYEQSRLMDRYIQILGHRMELLNVNDFIKKESK